MPWPQAVALQYAEDRLSILVAFDDELSGAAFDRGLYGQYVLRRDADVGVVGNRGCAKETPGEPALDEVSRRDLKDCAQVAQITLAVEPEVWRVGEVARL